MLSSLFVAALVVGANPSNRVGRVAPRFREPFCETCPGDECLSCKRPLPGCVRPYNYRVQFDYPWSQKPWYPYMPGQPSAGPEIIDVQARRLRAVRPRGVAGAASGNAPGDAESAVDQPMLTDAGGPSARVARERPPVDRSPANESERER